MERRANPLARFGEVRLERPGIGAGSQARGPYARHALADRTARDYPPGEQARLGTHAEDQPAGEPLPQRLRRGGGPHQVGQGRLAALLEHLGRELHLQP